MPDDDIFDIGNPNDLKRLFTDKQLQYRNRAFEENKESRSLTGVDVQWIVWDKDSVPISSQMEQQKFIPVFQEASNVQVMNIDTSTFKVIIPKDTIVRSYRKTNNIIDINLTEKQLPVGIEIFKGVSTKSFKIKIPPSPEFLQAAEAIFTLDPNSPHITHNNKPCGKVPEAMRGIELPKDT